MIRTQLRPQHLFASFVDADGLPVAVSIWGIRTIAQSKEGNHTRISGDSFDVVVIGDLSRTLAVLEAAAIPHLEKVEKRLHRARQDLAKVRAQLDTEHALHVETKERYRRWARDNHGQGRVPDFLNDGPPTQRSRPALTESNDDEND